MYGKRGSASSGHVPTLTAQDWQLSNGKKVVDVIRNDNSGRKGQLCDTNTQYLTHTVKFQ